MKKCFLLAIALFISISLSAQSWQIVSPQSVRESGQRLIIPKQYLLAKVDDDILKEKLWKAPSENDADRSASTDLEIMLADGTMDVFEVRSYEMMEPALAAEFSDFKTFIGKSRSNPYRRIRIDYTLNGFRAVISDENGKSYIDPYQKGDLDHRIIYKKTGITKEEDWICQTDAKSEVGLESTERFAGDCTLRQYRIAVAATGEYTTFHGGTVAAGQAAIVTSMNRVNQIFEQDLSVRMVLIANNSSLVFTNAATDPYTNDNGGAMLTENQEEIDGTIGSANYDIGHVFSTAGGGVAYLRSLCNSGSKAGGVTGQNSPINDPFWIDYVAHEIGHQFGGNHTQNNSCQRNSSTAMEPGSASTIMGYAGICSPNVQSNSDAYFHAVSLQEMSAHITGAGDCGTNSSISNSPPTLSALSNYTVPASTPLVLEAMATDSDGDVITYCWEQMDNEIATMPPQSDNSGGPLFRSFYPSVDNKRYLPNISALATNSVSIWEVLPSVSREMNFRVTARDQLESVGCTSERDMVITVDGNSGPFAINESSVPTTVSEEQSLTLVWDVAGTDVAPVNCNTVDIMMSTDGGLTYPINLITGTANDGSEIITIPTGTTTTARIMIKSADNIFFDINDMNFEVEESVDGFTLEVSPLSISSCNDQSVTFTVQSFAIGNYSIPIVLNVSGLPSGASATIATNPIVPGNSSLVTLSGFNGATGTFSVQVEGTSGGNTNSKTLELILLEATSTPTLLSPSNGATGVESNPLLSWNPSTGATSYEYQVSSIPGGTGNIASGSVTDTDVQIIGLESLSLYYWRVRAVNDCGPTAWSNERSFETGECTTILSPNVPFATADGFYAFTDMEVSLPGLITDVDVVQFVGVHTYVSDLIVDLSSPNGGGALISLFDGICGTDDDFNLNFDDDAATSNISCPPTSGGVFQPAASLSSFNGQNPTGTWTLRIGDRGPGDVGTLNSWGLKICTDDPGTCNLTVTSGAASGTGSLADAIDCAASGEVITISSDLPNDEINLGNTALLIDKNLTIKAQPGENIDINYTGTAVAFTIQQGFQVTLEGITLEQTVAKTTPTQMMMKEGKIILKGEK